MHIQGTLDGIVGRGDVPGLAVAGYDGRAAFAHFAGIQSVGSPAPVYKSTRFPIGCIGKLLLDIVVAQMCVEGRCDFKAPVAELLSGRDRAGWWPLGLTLGDLVTHTGGFREPRERAARWNCSWEALCDYMAAAEPRFPRGRVWSYCQVGHAAVARVIETLEGTSVEAAVEKRILRPWELGLSAEGSDPHEATPHMFSRMKKSLHPTRIPLKDGMLEWSISRSGMTIDDLLKLGMIIAGAPPYEAHLAPEVRRLLLSPTVRIEPQAQQQGSEEIPVAYSFGLGLYRDGSYGHNGSFVGSTVGLLFDAKARMVVAVALNAWRHDVRDYLSFGILNALRGRPATPPEAPELGAEASGLIGEYDGLMMSANSAAVDAGLNCAVDLTFGTVTMTLRESAQRLFIERSSAPLSLGPIHSEDGSIAGLRIGVSAFARSRGAAAK